MKAPNKKKGGLVWKVAAAIGGFALLRAMWSAGEPPARPVIHTVQVSANWTPVPMGDWNTAGKAVDLVANRAYRLRIGDQLLYGEPGQGMAIGDWPAGKVEIRFADHKPGELKVEVGAG